MPWPIGRAGQHGFQWNLARPIPRKAKAQPVVHRAAAFELQDEIYQIKDFSRKNVRVLLRLDADKLELTRKGVKRTARDFAVIWARNYGKGRVLYNGLGHVQAVWDRPEFQKMWLEMIPWSMGLVPGDATPRPEPDK
jgi:uncharacterized protein